MALDTLIDAGTGAHIGSSVSKNGTRITVMVGGGVIGPLVCDSVGRLMDSIDHGCVGQALEYAKSGQPAEWRNPDDGDSYTLLSGDAYAAAHGGYCREFSAEARVAGQLQQISDTACRRPDGAWQPIN